MVTKSFCTTCFEGGFLRLTSNRAHKLMNVTHSKAETGVTLFTGLGNDNE
jgi:hypothetical protein